MAVIRLRGSHINQEGSPSFFRTEAGHLFALGGQGERYARIENDFSRKDETANLDQVHVQHSHAAARFDAMSNSRVFITNNAPHITRLNEGWSSQSTAGFFERSVMEAKRGIPRLWKFREVAVGVLKQVP